MKEKTENQNNFIAGDVKIMVATSAFGMGVDKKDVGMVIHYDISDLLENQGYRLIGSKIRFIVFWEALLSCKSKNLIQTR